MIISDLGINAMPDQYSQKRIIYYLLSYYQDFSIRDIQLAFEFAIVGKISVDIEHYQSFDVKYLSNILNTFRKYRNEKQIRIRAKEENSKELSEEEKKILEIQYLKYLGKADKTYKTTGVLPISIHWIAYNQLVEIEVLAISESYWLELIQRAEKTYKNQLKQSKKKEDKEILKHFETVKYIYPFELTRIRNIAKKIAIQDFFKNLKINKKNLSDIFIQAGTYDQD